MIHRTTLRIPNIDDKSTKQEASTVLDVLQLK